MTVVTPTEIASAMRQHAVSAKTSERDDVVVDATTISSERSCDICGKTFATHFALNGHMTTHKPSVRKGRKRTTPYPRTTCKRCGARVGNNNFARHEQTCDGTVSVDGILDMIVVAMDGITRDNLAHYLKIEALLKDVVKG